MLDIRFICTHPIPHIMLEYLESPQTLCMMLMHVALVTSKKKNKFSCCSSYGGENKLVQNFGWISLLLWDLLYIYTVLGNLQELLQLEEDVKLLEEMYPQGEKVISVNDSTFCF